MRAELSSAANVTPFAFQRRSDKNIARRGIENTYDAKILEPFSLKKVSNDNRMLGRELTRGGQTLISEHRSV